ncbi:peptidoglycan-binding domain-containing protein [Streptomyces parvus]
MQLRSWKRTFVSSLAVAAIAAATVAGTSAAATAAPSGVPQAIAAEIAPQAVENLGLTVRQAKGVQRRYKEAGYDPGTIDGIAGPGTRAVFALSRTARVGFPASAKALPTCTHTYQYVPATSSGSWSCVLSSGNQGSGVRTLQQSLRECYQRNISVDAAFGPATREALLQVQRRVGAATDGVYGPETRRKMKWLTASGCVYRS